MSGVELREPPPTRSARPRDVNAILSFDRTPRIVFPAANAQRRGDRARDRDGCDDQRRESDGDGNLRDSWTPADAQAFDAKPGDEMWRDPAARVTIR
jgi:predicted metalloendopeptidase